MCRQPPKSSNQTNQALPETVAALADVAAAGPTNVVSAIAVLAAGSAGLLAFNERKRADALAAEVASLKGSGSGSGSGTGASAAPSSAAAAGSGGGGGAQRLEALRSELAEAQAAAKQAAAARAAAVKDAVRGRGRRRGRALAACVLGGAKVECFHLETRSLPH